MKVIKSDYRISGDAQPPKGRFHGHALQTLLSETAERTSASFVRFEPGAHTHWHNHSGGQVLHIVEGRQGSKPGARQLILLTRATQSSHRLAKSTGTEPANPVR